MRLSLVGPRRRVWAVALFISLAVALLLNRDLFTHQTASAADSILPALGKTGELQVLRSDGKVAGACPLKHTSVSANISGHSARVTVTQEFINPTAEKIEAVYVFPLPHESAVDSMVMKVGDRTIRGEIKRRKEAREIYEAAKSKGHVASLLDQERPNIFTQSVANITPGAKVVVTISYVELLDYEAGTYEFIFPMVVGPRYMPGMPTGKLGTGWSPDTNKVHDASKISPPVTPPGTRSGHDISISLSIDAGLPLGDIISTQHEISIKHIADTQAEVALKDQDTVPNKDFILRYRVGGDGIQSGLLAHTRQKGDGFFTLILQPPPKPRASQIVPKEMIFVIDSSGSQMGEPIEKSKETMELCIRQMNPDDTFQLISFSNDVEKLFDSPQPNTPENQTMALTYLHQRLGSGGTEMMKAIDASLLPAPDPKRLRVVCFMTDGYVGNDMEILAAVKKNVGAARLFSFGIGSSVNRFLLDGMAKLGRGAVEYVTLGSPGEVAAGKFHERIANPMLTDISIDWGRLRVSQTYPDLIPDLFSSKPLVIKGRYSARGSGTITIHGKIAGRPWSQTLNVTLPESEPEHDSLAAIWGRARIDSLMEQDYSGLQSGQTAPALEKQITETALDFHLMSQFTSFVAVEEKTVTEGGQPKTVAVPVEMPEGVSYEGIFGDKEDSAKSSQLRSLGYLGSSSAAPSSSVQSMTFATGGVAGMGGGGNGRHSAKRSAAPATSAIRPHYDSVTARQVLTQELSELVKTWKKSGKAPSGSKAKIQSGKVETVIWMTISDENLAKLRAMNCKVVTSSKSAGMVLAWVPIGKLEMLSKLQFIQSISLPNHVGKQ